MRSSQYQEDSGQGQLIQLPPHLFIPNGAQSLDLVTLGDVSAGSSNEIWRFVSPAGSLTQILYYGIFNDGLLASDFDFIPKVNNKRVYPYHGDPLKDFRIYLGLAPDLGNGSLKNGQLTLQPGDIFSWTAVNRSAVAATMGVRVVGYIDTEFRTQGRNGG